MYPVILINTSRQQSDDGIIGGGRGGERKKAVWLLAADEERRVQGKGRQRERGETALLRRRLPVSAEGWQVRRFPGTRGETRNAESLALVERAVT